VQTAKQEICDRLGCIDVNPIDDRADNFLAAIRMLHLYAALAEKERRLISERTKAALATKKAAGATLAIPVIWLKPALWGGSS